MAINIRAKGAEGEREVIALLEPIVRQVLQDEQYPLPEKPILQRNQNQSAVGGKDINNAFGLSIEVKRQEQLSINAWWRQCVAAAERNKEIPVLMYRQNGKRKWRIVLHVYAPLPACTGLPVARTVRGEVDQEDFLVWFAHHVRATLRNGYNPVT